MLVIDYNKFINMLNNPDKTINNKNSMEYKHINNFVNHKNKNSNNYTINNLMELLANGFRHNKNMKYTIELYY